MHGKHWRSEDCDKLKLLSPLRELGLDSGPQLGELSPLCAIPGGFNLTPRLDPKGEMGTQLFLKPLLLGPQGWLVLHLI